MQNEIAPGGIARRAMLRATLRLVGGVALLGATVRVAAADGTEIGIDNFKFARNPPLEAALHGVGVIWKLCS